MSTIQPNRWPRGRIPITSGRRQAKSGPFNGVSVPTACSTQAREPAKGRLGGALMRVNTHDLSLKVWPTPIANQSIEYVAAGARNRRTLLHDVHSRRQQRHPDRKIGVRLPLDTKAEKKVFQADPLPGTRTYVGRSALARG